MQNIPHLIRNLLVIGLVSLGAAGCSAFRDDDDDDDEPKARIQQDRLGDEDTENASD
jgi:hypothetical protein